MIPSSNTHHYYPRSFPVGGDIPDFSSLLHQHPGIASRLQNASPKDRLQMLADIWRDNPKQGITGFNAEFNHLRQQALSNVPASRKTDAAHRFAVQATEYLCSFLKPAARESLVSVATSQINFHEKARQILLLQQAHLTAQDLADTIANLSSADRVAALFAAYEGSLNNHILAQFRKNVQHEIKHFQSQYPIEDKADCNKNFSRALQAELTDICVSPELANMLKITAISNSGKDAHYQSAREAMYIFLCPDAIPANRPVVNDAHMPSGGTSVPIQQIKNKNTIVASPPQTDWTHSLDKNGRLDPYKHEALLNGVGHQMIEQTELHTGRRIVLNMTDSPPWFSSLPEKQLKKAEKLGVQATTDIVVFLRNKGIEVVFFKHGKRRRFWELVEADLRFRHPFQSGLKFHSMLRSDDLVLQADGFNPRKR